MSSIAARRSVVALLSSALLILCRSPQALGQPITDDFMVALTNTGQATGWAGTGFAGGEWFFYPNTNWWNVWFANPPYQPQLTKTVHLEFDVMPFGPVPHNLTVVYNWSTGAWSDLGLGRPPLPIDVPTPFLENQYIVRSAQIFNASVPMLIHVSDDFLMPQCADWISLDIRGAGVQIINGVITHECLAPTTDFGDAPAPYPTLLANNGPRHTVGNLFLGALVDPEPDGQPTAQANGDDTAGLADEDGVVWLQPLIPGQGSLVQVTLGGGVVGAMLSAWIDYNGDGNWDTLGDQIFVAQGLNPGPNPLPFMVPPTATPNITTYARFRVHTNPAGIPYTGSLPYGEVEDHIAQIEQGQEVGACCHGDPPINCIVTDRASCEQLLAGTYMGDNTDCSDLNGNTIADVCEQGQHFGACCSLQTPGACGITDPPTCQLLGGVYMGDGTNCDDLDFDGQADICELLFLDVDRGDAPEGALAYPGLGVIGQFPTCINVGPAGWIQHTNFGGMFGGIDFEFEGNAGFCPLFTPDSYDRDECFSDGDAGLQFPDAFTIQGPVGSEVVVPCPASAGAMPLGAPCTSATWGLNVDILVQNFMPGASKGYVNVLIDWDQSGSWSGASPCPTGSAPEHVLVNFEVPNGYAGPLSGVIPPPLPFLIGPNSGYVWARFMFSEKQVPIGWTGDGFYEDGETEDYLLLVAQPQGACCYGDPPTQCMVTDRATCEQMLMGQYMGDGSNCDDANSNGIADICEPAEPEACCLFDGTCVMALRPDCLMQLGTPQGAGSACTGILLPCCLPDGTCVMVESQCCDDLNGVPSPTGQTTCLGDPNGNGVDDACEQPQPIMACCLPDGSCVDTTYNDCIQQGGDPYGPGSGCLNGVHCHPLKWAQPPLFNPQSPHDECFWGWDEPSIYGGYQIVADDWRCDGPDPVTNIHWWGSYLGWDGIDPPADAPARFHIGVWTDVPANPNVDPPTPSHPGTMIWQWIVDRAQLHERPVACDFHPDHMQTPEACFRYDYFIPEEQWFWQPPLPVEAVYWISISAVYDQCPCNADFNGDGSVNALDLSQLMACIGLPPTGPCAAADLNCDGQINPADIAIFMCWFECPGSFEECQQICCPNFQPPPQFLWGWKSRPHFFNDDGFGVTVPSAPTPGSEFESGYPIDMGWDFAFVLTTETVACCLSDGTCLDVTLSDCITGHNGMPQGPGTTCQTMLPVFVQQPVGDEFCAGDDVTLAVIVCGNDPFVYQWWKAGSPPTPVGVDDPELKFNSVQMSDAGSYYVDVTDAAGNTQQSAWASLTVYPTGTGDCDASGAVNGADIQPFVDAVLHGSPPLPPRCAADMDLDGDVDINDVPLFVSALLS